MKMFSDKLRLHCCLTQACFSLAAGAADMYTWNFFHACIDTTSRTMQVISGVAQETTEASPLDLTL